MKFILTAIYIVLTTSGLTCFKLGGDSLSLSFKSGFTFKMGFMTALGFVLYLGSFILWQKLLATYDLSYIVPITTGIVQIIVLLIGVLYFHESINVFNIIGVILIVMGVILLTIKTK